MTTRTDLTARADSRADTMLEALKALVECESPSHDLPAVNRCADLLGDIGTRWLGRKPQRVDSEGRPHLLWEATGEAKVLVLGHLDTVWPIGTITDWPFRVEDGVASGPGVFDMKAGLVIALTAAAILDDPSGVTLLFNSDEEIGSTSSQLLIEEHARRAGAVLVCEPSADGGAVKIGRKGIAHYRLEARGRAAHAGLEPHLGVNAAIEIAHQMLALSAVARPGEGTTVTPTVTAAGTTINTVPERASVHIDARAWTRAELERVDRQLRELQPVHPEAALTLHGQIDRQPFEPHSAQLLIGAAEAAARDVGLPPLRTNRSGGASDANITAAIGIPTLDGLGAIGAHPHARSERADVTSMPTRAAFLAAALLRICEAR